MTAVWISVGSNIEPEQNIESAFDLVRKLGTIRVVSKFYLTPAIGSLPQADFYNGMMVLDTELGPMELKRSLRNIETSLGRMRNVDRFAPRSIDLDIVLFDDEVIRNEEIVVPDPDLFDRYFLAFLVHETSTDCLIPGTMATVSQLLEGLVPQPMTPLAQFSQRILEKVQK